MFSDFIFQGALKFWRKLEDRVLKDGFRFCWGYPKSGLLWSSNSDHLSSNLGILEDSFQGYHQHHVVESFGWHIIVKLRFIFKSVLSKCPVKSFKKIVMNHILWRFELMIWTWSWVKVFVACRVSLLRFSLGDRNWYVKYDDGNMPRPAA